MKPFTLTNLIRRRKRINEYWRYLLAEYFHQFTFSKQFGLCLMHCLGIAQCVTIIGIPVGIAANFKIAAIALWPVGRRVVSVETTARAHIEKLNARRRFRTDRDKIAFYVKSVDSPLYWNSTRLYYIPHFIALCAAPPPNPAAVAGRRQTPSRSRSTPDLPQRLMRRPRGRLRVI